MARNSERLAAGERSRSLRVALQRRGAEFNQDGSGRWYGGWVHRSNLAVAAELRPMVEDPGDRRYFRLGAGEDHEISEEAFAVVADDGRHLAGRCAGPDGALAEFRDL